MHSRLEWQIPRITYEKAKHHELLNQHAYEVQTMYLKKNGKGRSYIGVTSCNGSFRCVTRIRL